MYSNRYLDVFIHCVVMKIFIDCNETQTVDTNGIFSFCQNFLLALSKLE